MKPKEISLKGLEVMTLCLDCQTRWDGIVLECEKCGAKYSNEPYESRLERYFHYDDVPEFLADKLTELQKLAECKTHYNCLFSDCSRKVVNLSDIEKIFKE